MTGLEGFVCGALIVIAVWLIDSGLKDHNSSLKNLIQRIVKTVRRNTK